MHTLRVRLTDTKGHVTGWTDHVVRIDSTLPVDRTSVSSAWQPPTSLNVTVHGTDDPPGSGVDHIDYKLDGTPATIASDTGDRGRQGQGEHTLETRIVDVAGNTDRLGAAHGPPRLDRADQPHADRPMPAGATRPWSVVLNGIGLTTRASRRCEWRVDNGVVNNGTHGIETARVTADGTQHLYTRIKDIAGNYSVWRDETIKIDTVKPTDTTAGAGAPVGNGHKIHVTGHGRAVRRCPATCTGSSTTAPSVERAGDDRRRRDAHAQDAGPGQRGQLERLEDDSGHGRSGSCRARTPIRRSTTRSSRAAGRPARPRSS